MRKFMWVLPLAVLIAAVVSGCATTPKGAEGRQELSQNVQETIREAKQEDPGIRRFFDESVGYAVFPGVGEAAVGIGGAFGRGEVHENGRLVGYATLTQADIGLSLGGQKYAELIFFDTQEALDAFKSGEFTFTAQASAVALEQGASTQTDFSNGVAIFTMGEAGLMLQASVGGQKFSYRQADFGQESAVTRRARR